MPLPLTNLSARKLNAQEPQRVNNHILHIVGLSALPDVPGTATLSDADPDADDLSLAIESFPIPKRSIGTIELGYLNEKRKFAGSPVYENMNVVYKDLVTNDIRGVLHAWFNAVNNSTTGVTGLATTYKMNGYCYSFAPDGTLARQYNVYGIFPTNFDPGDADMSNGDDFNRVTLDLSIDKAIISDSPGTSPGLYAYNPGL
jgi:hypothetical protein